MIFPIFRFSAHSSALFMTLNMILHTGDTAQCESTDWTQIGLGLGLPTHQNPYWKLHPFCDNEYISFLKKFHNFPLGLFSKVMQNFLREILQSVFVVNMFLQHKLLFKYFITNVTSPVFHLISTEDPPVKASDVILEVPQTFEDLSALIT